MTKYWLILALVLPIAAACSSSDAGDDDDVVPSADAAPVGDGLATISGTVGRSVEPMAGGVGPLYIALFTEDPVTAMETPTPVQTIVIDDADLSAADAALPYTLDDVPVSEQPYYMTAFLDDNHNATADAAGPDMGDLVSLDGFASPAVTVDHDGTISFDIDLNLAMPF